MTVKQSTRFGAALAAATLIFSGCTMQHGDATISSQGHGAQLGGNLGFQVGGTSVSGGTGGGGGGGAPGR